MFKNIDTYKASRWGQDESQFDTMEIISKKDQKIRQLQAQLQQQKNRADNAIQMLESLKSTRQQVTESSEGLRSEVTRRIKAEDQVKLLERRNKQLENGLRLFIHKLQLQKVQKQRALKEMLPNVQQQQN